VRAKSLETALEKVARVITDRYGLRLVCEGDRCKTNGKTIYLPSLPDTVPDELLAAIRGWADHECAHAIHTQTRLGPIFRERHGREAFAVLNALEDARVERLMGRRYPGARINLEEGFRFVREKARQGGLRAAGPFDRFVSALYTRASGRPDQSWIPREAYLLADACEQELSELPSCRKTSDVAGLALRIWEKVRAAFPATNGQKNQAPVLPDPQPPAADNSSACDTGNAPDEHREGQPSAANQEPTTPEAVAEGISPIELLSSLIEAELGRAYSGDGGEYRVYTTEHDVVEVPEPVKGFDLRREIEELRPYVSGLRRRLLQTLMGRSETRWLGDRAMGSLNPRALHRLLTGSTNRIFRQRIEARAPNTACTLLLDLSSSMSGRRIELCRKLALLFAESLDVLGFPTEIIGFSTVDLDLREKVSAETGIPEDELAKRFARFVPLYHAVFKGFGEPWRVAAPRLEAVRTHSLTPLGESLLFAGKRLASRPESRKVLFCLTDGKPVVGAWDENITWEHACKAVKRLSRAGIEPVGIGMMERCVAGIFPDHAVIHRLSELPRGFLTQLCKVLTRQ